MSIGIEWSGPPLLAASANDGDQLGPSEAKQPVEALAAESGLSLLRSYSSAVEPIA
ncbi:MAG: hypothetical protein ACI82F_002922 [Planctomycetota bacterium]